MEPQYQKWNQSCDELIGHQVKSDFAGHGNNLNSIRTIASAAVQDCAIATSRTSCMTPCIVPLGMTPKFDSFQTPKEYPLVAMHCRGHSLTGAHTPNNVAGRILGDSNLQAWKEPWGVIQSMQGDLDTWLGRLSLEAKHGSTYRVDVLLCCNSRHISSQ